MNGRRPRYSLLLLLFLSIFCFILKMKPEERTSHLNFNKQSAFTLSGFEDWKSGIACDLKVFLFDKEIRLTHCTRGPNTTKRGSLNIKANSNHGSFNIVMSNNKESYACKSYVYAFYLFFQLTGFLLYVNNLSHFLIG